MLLRFVLVIAVIAPQAPPRDVSVSSALAQLNGGRVFEAIDQFKQIVRSDPANGQSYYYLSTLYTQLGELETAARYVRKAMELNPKQGAHYLQLGLIRFRQKQWRSALEFLKQALQFSSGSTAAAVWRSIGDAQVELFDREAALQAYETSVSLEPRDAASRLALGRFYLDRSDPERAIVQLRAALEIDPTLGAAYPVLGRAYRQTGDLAQAAGILKKAVDTDPADQESRYALGQVLLAAGREDEGQKELDQYESIRLQVTTANSRYMDALERLEGGKTAEAEQLLRTAVRLAPKYGPALHSLGVLLLDRGSARDAAEMLNRAVQSNPLNAASWFNLGKAYLKTGRLSDAQEAARRAAVLGDEDQEYQQLLADIESRTKR
jgi:tetratricopeptide (TPR) repeat protein